MGQMESKQAVALRQVSGTAIAKSGVVEVSALTKGNGTETLHGNSGSEGSAWDTKVEIVRLPPHRDEPVHFLADPYLGMTSDQFNEVLDVFPFFKRMGSPQDLGLLFAMWLNCDPCSGVWWGSASELAQGTTLKSVYRSLLAMKDGEFINYAQSICPRTSSRCYCTNIRFVVVRLRAMSSMPFLRTSWGSLPMM
jgi:hypothetical protein